MRDPVFTHGCVRACAEAAFHLRAVGTHVRLRVPGTGVPRDVQEPKVGDEVPGKGAQEARKGALDALEARVGSTGEGAALPLC